MIDRAGDLRTRQTHLATLLASDGALFVPMWRNKNLVVDQQLRFVARDGALIDAANEVVFLGMRGDSPCFALALDDERDAPALDGHFNDLRMAGPFMDPDDAQVAAYARGLIHWHRHHRHCGKCGLATRSIDGGHVRVCEGCAKKHFPRTDPAIMALIIDGDRCVLARQPGFPPRMYSILAGFVEPGESLEAAVVREVREEVGLEVDAVRYVRSQAWPFPSSLMLGFVMRAATREIVVDKEELEDARWVTRAEIQAADAVYVPPTFSLAGQLIALFLNDDL